MYQNGGKNGNSVFGERRKYHIYRCPNCKQEVRVQGDVGRIQIHCPKCGNNFIKTS